MIFIPYFRQYILEQVSYNQLLYEICPLVSSTRPFNSVSYIRSGTQRIANQPHMCWSDRKKRLGLLKREFLHTFQCNRDSSNAYPGAILLSNGTLDALKIRKAMGGNM